MSTSNPLFQFKKCSKCGEVFPSTTEYFYTDCGKLYSHCKKCHKKMVQGNRNLYKIEQLEKSCGINDVKKFEEADLKVCSKCGRMLPETAEYFHRHRDGFRADCKICCSEYGKQYRQKKKEEIEKKKRLMTKFLEHKSQEHQKKKIKILEMLLRIAFFVIVCLILYLLCR